MPKASLCYFYQCQSCDTSPRPSMQATVCNCLSLSFLACARANPRPAVANTTSRRTVFSCQNPISLCYRADKEPILFLLFLLFFFFRLSSRWLILLPFLTLPLEACPLPRQQLDFRAAGCRNRPRATPKDFLHFRSRNRLPVVGKSAYPRNAEQKVKSSHRHGFRRGG